MERALLACRISPVSSAFSRRWRGTVTSNLAAEGLEQASVVSLVQAISPDAKSFKIVEIGG